MSSIYKAIEDKFSYLSNNVMVLLSHDVYISRSGDFYVDTPIALYRCIRSYIMYNYNGYHGTNQSLLPLVDYFFYRPSTVARTLSLICQVREVGSHVILHTLFFCQGFIHERGVAGWGTCPPSLTLNPLAPWTSSK